MTSFLFSLKSKKGRSQLHPQHRFLSYREYLHGPQLPAESSSIFFLIALLWTYIVRFVSNLCNFKFSLRSAHPDIENGGDRLLCAESYVGCGSGLHRKVLFPSSLVIMRYEFTVRRCSGLSTDSVTASYARGRVILWNWDLFSAVYLLRSPRESLREWARLVFQNWPLQKRSCFINCWWMVSGRWIHYIRS